MSRTGEIGRSAGCGIRHDRSTNMIVAGYNEGEKIREDLIKIKTFLDNSIADSWELIFVNDGSTDDTIKNISDLQNQITEIKSKYNSIELKL